VGPIHLDRSPALRTLVTGTLSIAVLVLGACDAGDEAPLSAGQERGAESSEAGVAEGDEGDEGGAAPPVTVAEHTLGEERGFVVTASFEDEQVCLTATPLDVDGETRVTTAVTDCAAPDTPLDLRVLTLGADLAVVAGVVTDPRAATVTLVDRTGQPVPDEVDAVPLVELPGTEHRVFAAATPPDALREVELADDHGTVIGDRPLPSASSERRAAP
jgi:hypothetical protein